MCSSGWCGSTRTAWDRDWTFVRCPTVPVGARARATVSMLWWWWNFIWWRRMTWNRWRDLNWWLSGSRRLAHVALLVLVHKRLHAGFNRVLHLLHHLFCIEGYTGSRWCGLRCHRCWWIRHCRCGLSWMWIERGLMEWKKLLEVLDMRLSLWRKLLIQDGILLSESRQLCLSLSLRLSLWLLVHKITATKLTLKSHRLRVPEGPHVVGNGRIPSRKHGSTVRFVNCKISSKRKDASTWTCRDPLIRLNGLRSRQPYRRLSVFKWITCTIEPHQTTKKESDHTCKACPLAWSFMWKWLRSVSWDNRKSVDAAAVYHPLKFDSQAQRATFQHNDIDKWDQEKGQQFTLLRRITNSKV